MKEFFLRLKKGTQPRLKLILGIAAVLALAAAVHFAAAAKNKEDAGVEGKSPSQPAATTGGTASEGDTAPKAVYCCGTLEAVTQVEIVPEARGKILESPYEVGNKVAKGDLLALIDDNGLKDAVLLTRNSLARMDLAIAANNKSLADLKVYAPAGGVLREFRVTQGERVNSGKLGKIIDEDTIVAVVPFSAKQVRGIAVGNPAVLYSAEHMSSVSGKVSYVYEGKTQTADGSILYDVEIKAANPGAFVVGTAVTAEVETSAGKVVSPATGTTKDDSVSLVGRASGYAKTVYVREGQKVKKGQLILEIENETLETTARRTLLDRKDLEIKLQMQQKNLNACSIRSPMSGVVVKKTCNALDTITSTSQSIMTIADTQCLTLKLQVSDKDISGIQSGMEISLTTDSKEHPTIKGTVTGMDAEGKIVSGEKKHSVEITVENTYNLLPGVQAGISFPPAVKTK